MERIGILGGTFDPPHVGHFLLAADARWEMDLDQVWVLPAKDPWQKRTVEATTLDRLVMADMAFQYVPWAKVVTAEIDRPGPTFTIDTLRELSHPDRELVLIIGSDQMGNFETWKDHEEIPQLATICPLHRWLGVSSTLIRDRLKVGRGIEHLVIPEVAEYIYQKGLYGASR